MEASSAFCGQLPNVRGLQGCAASGNSSSTFRSVTSVCGLCACGTSAVAEPDFLCYCGEPARKLTAGFGFGKMSPVVPGSIADELVAAILRSEFEVARGISNKQNWCIRARVARMWEYCGGRDGLPPLHVVLVLADDEGDVMYAEGAGRDADIIKCAVKEGGVYTFTKFLVKLVLWGSRATEFDAEAVHKLGQEHAVVGIFVGTLVKSYRGEETLTGGSACKWYFNEDIAEIDEFFERLGDDFSKIEWVDDYEESGQRLQKIDRAVLKTVSELRGLDPWESEGTNFMCTVTIVRMSTGQPWWFLSCSRCHKAATTCGSEYKCAGGCVNTTATPK
ncbi:replication protein A 70 kDa DNA-binding subunit B-like [Panicum miliaceum]|uniref:Replication protein A 70 kDa DNA-binding subunit B-like n=1 Tax=Panicum miliaceum TaxID=4540 RepID=A0A3L6R0T4_PANMI|nr:replication protein A 70 kDa DNA-binding subunit B-like [Panicum miliaceum]